MSQGVREFLVHRAAYAAKNIVKLNFLILEVQMSVGATGKF